MDKPKQNDPVEIKSITLKVKGQDLVLTLLQARELLGALRGLLEGTSPISIPYPMPVPYPIYPRLPIWVKSEPWVMPYWTVTATNTGNVSVTYS